VEVRARGCCVYGGDGWYVRQRGLMVWVLCCTRQDSRTVRNGSKNPSLALQAQRIAQELQELDAFEEYVMHVNRLARRGGQHEST